MLKTNYKANRKNAASKLKKRGLKIWCLLLTPQIFRKFCPGAYRTKCEMPGQKFSTIYKPFHNKIRRQNKMQWKQQQTKKTKKFKILFKSNAEQYYCPTNCHSRSHCSGTGFPRCHATSFSRPSLDRFEAAAAWRFIELS